MGCDIHLWVEARKSPRHAWHPAFPQAACPWCSDGRPRHAWHPWCSDGRVTGGADGKCYWCGGTKFQSTYDGRNYNLFAMLANVRNGTGFAGVKTGDGYEPIHEQRGYPEDMSKELRKHIDNFDYEENEKVEPRKRLSSPGDHSESWATLAELQAYFAANEKRDAKHQGVIALGQYTQWEGGLPEGGWSGGVSGPKVRILTPAEAKVEVEKRPPKAYETRGDGHIDGRFVRVTWTSTYADDAGRFVTEFMPACAKLGEPENVRMIYGFDS